MVDRKTLVAAASEFVERQNVTHYFTLTYPRRRSWEARREAFWEWLDAIEWMQRRPLGWFRADEMRRFSGCGFPEIPEHHHGLLVDTDHLCCRTAESIWRAFGDAQVERYERHGGAIMGMLFTSAAAGSLFGPTITGELVDRTASYAFAILGGAALFVLAAASLPALPKPPIDRLRQSGNQTGVPPQRR